LAGGVAARSSRHQRHKFPRGQIACRLTRAPRMKQPLLVHRKRPRVSTPIGCGVGGCLSFDLRRAKGERDGIHDPFRAGRRTRFVGLDSGVHVTMALTNHSRIRGLLRVLGDRCPSPLYADSCSLSGD
jgi:hypothetical protein